MTKMEYAEAIAELVGGKVNEVNKANGIKMVGITRHGESNISPNVYIDWMYDDNMSVEEGAKYVSDTLLSIKVDNFDVDNLLNFDKVKPMLRARLYNSSTQAEVYKPADEYGYEGLIIVPVIKVEGFDCEASTAVKWHMIDTWKVTRKEVFDIALRNSAKDVEFSSLNDAILRELATYKGKVPDYVYEEIIKNFKEYTETPMTVISNAKRYYGAIGAIAARAKLTKMFPKGYAIIPSSVHECIVLPLDGNKSEKELNSLVNEVNTTSVKPEEVLSNRVYVFKGGKTA